MSAVSDRLVTTLVIPSASWPQKTQDIGQKQICPDWCREEGDCPLGLSGGSGEEGDAGKQEQDAAVED